MEIVIPRLDVEPAPRTPDTERYAPFYPQTIGRLVGRETADFSLPFCWSDVETDGYRMNDRGDTVHLGFTSAGSHSVHRYMVPDGLERFAPAIRQIGAFEHNRFPQDEPWAIKLTVRQSAVEAGRNQHTGTRRMLHSDGPFGSPDRFYVLSDIGPTQFFAKLYMTSTQLELPVGRRQPDFVPMPYEIAGASTSMFHRSPPMRRDTRRTFLRMTYKYPSER